jgi:hypothetical protein
LKRIKESNSKEKMDIHGQPLTEAIEKREQRIPELMNKTERYKGIS